MARRPRVSIVVPTYNERENLPRLVEAIRGNARWPYEIVVVDDASPDGTAEAAHGLAAHHPVRVVSRPDKLGLGSAYREGFLHARGEIIFEMDADLSHDPQHLVRLVDAVEGGAAVVIGSRYVRGGSVTRWGIYRRFVSRVGNFLARFVLGLRVRDTTSGFRCYRRDAARVVQSASSDGYAFQVESLFLAQREGFAIVEVPIVFENRAAGRSKLGPTEFVAFLAMLARLRFGPVRTRGERRRIPAP